MPRSDYVERLGALAQKAGVEVDPSQMTIAEMKREIRRLEKAAPPEPPAPPAPVNGAVDSRSLGGPPDPKPPEAPPVLFPFQIAPGKSIVCSRGVLGPGEEIRPKDVSGGVEQLEELVDRGYILKGLPRR